jgi:hypothetical protein
METTIFESDGKADKEEMYRMERRYRAMGVAERAIDIAMTKLDDAEEAAVLAVRAFKAGLAEFESGGF